MTKPLNGSRLHHWALFKPNKQRTPAAKREGEERSKEGERTEQSQKGSILSHWIIPQFFFDSFLDDLGANDRNTAVTSR
jgi:hypothetical protein